MKTQKVQSSQQVFGTKVQIDAHTARMFSLSKAKNKILKHINQLENNGIDDILTLSTSNNVRSYVRASVLKTEGNRCSVTFPVMEPFVYSSKNGNVRYVNIKNLYENAKKSLNEVIINKKDFQKFIQYIG